MVVTRILLCALTLGSMVGCSSLPLCGSPEAAGRDCSLGWGPTLAGFSSTLPQRDYVTNPITLPAAQPTNQPTFGPTPGSDYQNLTFNTPNGYVVKRCKVLSGTVINCL